MKNFVPLVILLSFLFTSCQKGIVWNDVHIGDEDGTDTTGGNTSATLLTKVVAVTGAETITTAYTYNSQNKSATTTITGSSGGINVGSYQRFERDAKGRIIRIVAKLADANGIPVDTSYKTVHYPDDATESYDYTISTLSIAGFETTDSTIYTFDGSGKLQENISYLSSSLLGGFAVLSTKTDYTYDATGNLSVMEVYADLGTGNLNLAATYNFTYDDKVNPLKMDAEAFLTNRTEGASHNNVTGLEINDETDPSRSITISTTLQYGADDKPVTGTATQQPGDLITRYTFYYQ